METHMNALRSAMAVTLLASIVLACLGQEPAGTTDNSTKLPAGPLGETIRLGRELVERTSTHEVTRPYVGNSLNCTSCHLRNGTDPKAASFIGVATAYPAWSPREQRVITLEDRVLNCFMRSCNGIRPPLGSTPAVAIVAYITWLSADQPMRMNPERPNGPLSVPKLPTGLAQPDRQNGQILYSERCASCHGEDGQGDSEAPPVWGERSYNEGAGLASVPQLAAWLHVAMPPEERNLSPPEAFDIAAYVNSLPRPHFRLEAHLPEKSRLGEYNSAANE
jgi:thiosulfate dehydrogenase